MEVFTTISNLAAGVCINSIIACNVPAWNQFRFGNWKLAFRAIHHHARLPLFAASISISFRNTFKTLAVKFIRIFSVKVHIWTSRGCA